MGQGCQKHCLTRWGLVCCNVHKGTDPLAAQGLLSLCQPRKKDDGQASPLPGCVCPVAKLLSLKQKLVSKACAVGSRSYSMNS